MLLPISFTAAANSFSRRPVINTYAPSPTNPFAVASPIPLLPPVISAILPSSLPTRSSSFISSPCFSLLGPALLQSGRERRSVVAKLEQNLAAAFRFQRLLERFIEL